MAADHPFALQGPAQIIAHRGYSARAPENTISALSLALDHGATAVEFDVHSAGDGTPVLLHDATLDRTTSGRGPVTDYSAAELSLLDAGSWFGPEFAGEPVPSLEDTLAEIKARISCIFAELKGVRDIGDVAAIVALSQSAELGDRTIFISMDWALLDEIRRCDPEARIGLIVHEPALIDPALARAQGDPHCLLDFDAEILLARPEVAARARNSGIALAAWTVDEVHQAEQLFAMGVPRITTNEVTRLLAWAKSLEER